MSKFGWPDGVKCAVSLTFDVDGECIPLVFDRANAYRRLTLLSESAYGPNVGLPLLLELLARYDIKSTFFVPGFTADLRPHVIEQLVEDGHEVAHHGYYHERPFLLSDAEEEEVLLKGIDSLTRITGTRPIGYRSPSWEIKPSTPALLKKHQFTYDTSLMGHFVPYRIAAGEGELIELPVQWFLDDMPLFAFMSYPPFGQGISNPSQVLETWSEEFDGIAALGGCFVLTMHPRIIGRPSRLLMLERLIQHMRKTPGVWFARLADVAAHCEQFGEGELIEFPKEFFDLVDPAIPAVGR